MNNKKKPVIIVIILLILILIGLGVFLFLKNDKKQSKEIKPLDLTKCLNCNESWIFENPTEENQNDYFVIHNKEKVTVTINWPTFCEVAGNSDCVTEAYDYEVRDLNKKVKGSIVGGRGKSVEATAFYYLLEDGTVHYTKLFATKEDNFQLNFQKEGEDEKTQVNYFKAEGPIKDIKNIVKLYNVSVHTESGITWLSTIGATQDGSFYDLGV